MDSKRRDQVQLKADVGQSITDHISNTEFLNLEEVTEASSMLYQKTDEERQFSQRSSWLSCNHASPSRLLH